MFDSLVTDIIKNSVDREWVHHGLGFMKLNLPNGTRIHIWDDRLKTEGATPLHDHPWGFFSTIIKGRLTNRRYKRVLDAVEGVPYIEALLHCGESLSTENPTPVFLVPHAWSLHRSQDRAEEKFSRVGLEPGSDSYYQSAEDIHETAAEHGTITVIRRQFKLDETTQQPLDKAHVFWPVGGQFVDAHQGPATKAAKEAVITTALS